MSPSALGLALQHGPQDNHCSSEQAQGMAVLCVLVPGMACGFLSSLPQACLLRVSLVLLPGCQQLTWPPWVTKWSRWPQDNSKEPVHAEKLIHLQLPSSGSDLVPRGLVRNAGCGAAGSG